VATPQPSEQDTSQHPKLIPHYTSEQIDAILKAGDQFMEDIEMASVLDFHYIQKYYEMLNLTGRQIALRQIKDLTKIPEYLSDDPFGSKDRETAIEQMQLACATVREAMSKIQASLYYEVDEDET
jgi:hypothetical protein